MSKYDKMLASNKKTSDAKIELATRTIIMMVDEGEKVTIPKLMEKTGLSRGFFYKNQTVRKEIDRALEMQVGMRDPRRNILDMAMNEELHAMERKLAAQIAENKSLKEENEKLRKALGKKNLNLIKSL